MPIDDFSKIVPSFGPVFHGKWEPGYVERNRRIYDFELVYFAQGTTKVIFPDKVFLCPAESTIIIPPNLVHCSIALNAVERWCIHFDWFSDCRGPRGLTDVYVYTDAQVKFDQELCASAPEQLEFPLFSGKTGFTLPLIRQYFKQAESQNNRLLRQGLLLQILGLFLPEAEGKHPGKKNNHLMLKVKDCIDEKCQSLNFRITDIAEELQVTPNHLSRLFRSQIGCSITEYVMQKRFYLAQQLLQKNNSPIAQIAEQCGFPDVNYFCRFFRKMSGTSPNVWRKN